MRKAWIFILLMMISTTPAYAGVQKYKLDGEHRIEGIISKEEQNRIMIEGDRISEVIGLGEEFVVETEETKGQVFLKVQEQVTSPAIFSVITEDGKVQDFKLSVDAKVEGQVIVVKSEDVELKGSKHLIHEEVVEVIKHVFHTGDELHQKSFAIAELSVKPLAVRKSGKYTVEVFVVRNQSTAGMKLQEQMFYDNGAILAIGVEDLDLMPMQETKMYRVCLGRS